MSAICLLSWVFLIGLLTGEGSPDRSEDAFLMTGYVEEVITWRGNITISIISFPDSHELSFSIPAGMVIPEVGRTVVISCHATDSGPVLDDLYTL